MQAKSAKDAAEGLTFMREMSKWNELSDMDNGVIPAGLLVNNRIIPAGPGHFGKEISGQVRYTGSVAYVQPSEACTPIINKDHVAGKFAVAMRGQCTFAQKVRNMKAAGATLAIITDNVPGSSSDNTPLFAMSGDGQNDIEIPAIFIFTEESAYLSQSVSSDPDLTVTVGELKAMRQNVAGCAEGNCDTTIGPSEDNLESMPADRESFEHLKKVLSQLVAQFELSLSNDENNLASQKNNNEDSKFNLDHSVPKKNVPFDLTHNEGEFKSCIVVDSSLRSSEQLTNDDIKVEDANKSSSDDF